ncbi:MAG: hypothetical protein M5U01_28130 [Ardenticatenaceae bacterium]|nr:hypothetical protein [Ardenticatenaceae bacterium]HBY98946.1 hypothetical protein [Chloroflexota bacterium]
MKNPTSWYEESCAPGNLCDTGLIERPRYFPRQLITPVEMTLEQQYFRDKLRRHNRLLHGWGVVCGALVCPIAGQDGLEPWKVVVQPGYVLGPYGDEIVIDGERVVDLRTSGVTGMTGEPGREFVDPWCSQVFVERREGPLYVAVKYKEVMTRPVRVQPVGCGCDDTQCEYSRWQDGYEIKVLDQCPDSHKMATKQQRTSSPREDRAIVERLRPGEIEVQRRLPLVDCPPCPSDPWVVLAMVQLGENGNIEAIDNCACRRIVLSPALYWGVCEGGLLKIQAVDPETLQQGARDVIIKVVGENFGTEPEANLGRGVTVKNVDGVDEHTLEVTVDVADNAPLGPHTLTITNENCSVGTKTVTVAARQEAQPPGEAPAPERPARRRSRRRSEEEPE